MPLWENAFKDWLDEMYANSRKDIPYGRPFATWVLVVSDVICESSTSDQDTFGTTYNPVMDRYIDGVIGDDDVQIYVDDVLDTTPTVNINGTITFPTTPASGSRIVADYTYDVYEAKGNLFEPGDKISLRFEAMETTPEIDGIEFNFSGFNRPFDYLIFRYRLAISSTVLDHADVYYYNWNSGIWEDTGEDIQNSSDYYYGYVEIYEGNAVNTDGIVKILVSATSLEYVDSDFIFLEPVKTDIDCTTTCQISCQSDCQTSEQNCTSCQIACQVTCQTECEVSEQT